MAGLYSCSCVGIIGSKHITPKWIYMLQALCAPFVIVLLDVPISEPDVKVPSVGALRGSGHISFLTRVSRALKIAYNCNVCCCHKYNTSHTLDVKLSQRTGHLACDTVLYCLTLRTKSLCSFKVSGTTCPLTQCHIPEEWNLKICESLDVWPYSRHGSFLWLVTPAYHDV
jgi:hypothetical protein